MQTVKKKDSKAFMKVGKDWQLLQDKMRKRPNDILAVVPDIAELERLRDRIERTHRLFAEHIQKHDCWHKGSSPAKSRTKAKGRK
jgi:hypothetical protein